MHNLNAPVLKPALICTIQSLYLNVKTSHSVCYKYELHVSQYLTSSTLGLETASSKLRQITGYKWSLHLPSTYPVMKPRCEKSSTTTPFAGSHIFLGLHITKLLRQIAHLRQIASEEQHWKSC